MNKLIDNNPGWTILIFNMAFIAGIVGFANFANRACCLNNAAMMHRNAHWQVFGDCMIRTKIGWRPYSQLRHVELDQ